MEKADQLQGKKVCVQCGEEKDLDAFYRTKNGRDGRMKLCAKCHSDNLRARREEERRRQEQWERERAERERLEQERRERQERLEVYERERKEKRLAEIELWLETEPERTCIVCKKSYPITEFMFDQFHPLEFWHEPHLPPFQRCRLCHHHMREKRLLPCALCGEKIRSHFIGEFLGYRVDRDGIVVRVVCEACLDVFQKLPVGQQRFYIQARCKQLFPWGQVIYIHRDPRDQQIRYVGRTHDLARRTQAHLKSSYLYEPREVQGEIVPYYKGNWWYDLLQQGMKPIVETIAHIEPPPRVVEWEMRYIFHFIRQGAPLLNTEIHNKRLCECIAGFPLDFLTVPFDSLVQAGFFRSNHIEAFIDKWYS